MNLLMHKLVFILLTIFFTSPLAAMECADVAMADVAQEETFPFMELPREIHLYVIEHGIYSTLSKKTKSPYEIVAEEEGMTVQELEELEAQARGNPALMFGEQMIRITSKIFELGFGADKDLRMVSRACLEHVRRLAALRHVNRHFAALLEPKVMATSLLSGDYEFSLFRCLDHVVNYTQDDITWFQALVRTQEGVDRGAIVHIVSSALTNQNDKTAYIQELLPLLDNQDQDTRKTFNALIVPQKSISKSLSKPCNPHVTFVDEWLNQGNTHHKESSDT